LSKFGVTDNEEAGAPGRSSQTICHLATRSSTVGYFL